MPVSDGEDARAGAGQQRRGLNDSHQLAATAEPEGLEQRICQAHRMQAIGQLAAGVAHDFNNLLTVIGGYGAMARQRIGIGPGGGEVAEIERACERATRLTRQLLAFARPAALEPSVLDLNEVIRGLASMLRLLLGEQIEIGVLADTRLAGVLADRGQLEQVIVNLAINARDAMPSGGTFTLQTTMFESSATTVGRRVGLIVTDTGSGIDPEIAAHVFEPFFSTKPVGRGTGLGLATVHEIVTQTGGTIELCSQPGLGTSITVTLPPAEATITPAAAAAAADAPDRQRGSETILVCEDDDGVRALLEHILTAHGYTALTADRPSAALQLARAHRGPIDALVSDVTMPELAGPELAERLQALRPGLRTIFITGHIARGVAEHRALPADRVVLGKPFPPAALLRAVRDLLDHPRFPPSAPPERQTNHEQKADSVGRGAPIGDRRRAEPPVRDRARSCDARHV